MSHLKRLVKHLLIAMVIIVPVFILRRYEKDTSPSALVKLDVVTDMIHVIKRPASRYHADGPNNQGVTWAVFFHKPYCGACRRLRPALEALASSIEAEKHLRFASIDCVQYRVVCQQEGVNHQPRIRLYQTTDKLSYGNKPFERKVVAEWQGNLLAYELFNWLKGAQEVGHLSHKVEWPSDDEVAAKMLEYKAGGLAQVDGVTSTPSSNQGGYLKDISSAYQMSLVDHVFTTDAPLADDRLTALKRYVQALARTFPDSAVRHRLVSLHASLSERSTWDRTAYEALLASLRIRAAPADDRSAWSWCRSGGRPGVGGYTCGLWLLFHTMLSNADQYSAEDALGAVQLWVKEFFGCSECAKHFQEVWVKEGGANATSHVAASLWLWRAHNAVNARLSSDGSTSGKIQWPTSAACQQCHVPSQLAAVEPTTWNQNIVFVYLQETFCFKSDTLACAQFYDPSMDVEVSTWAWLRQQASAINTRQALGTLLVLVALTANVFLYKSFKTSRATALAKAYASEGDLLTVSKKMK